MGNVIDAVNVLKGIPFYILRISFADSRKRHYGISHHCLTILNKIAHSSAYIGIPFFNEKDKDEYIARQIDNLDINKKHKLKYFKQSTIDILKQSGMTYDTMGRGLKDDPSFFEAIGAAALFCLNNDLA